MGKQSELKERPLMEAQHKVLTGNGTAAYAAPLCRPEVIAAYPITPQSEVIEQLAKFVADGALDAEYVTVEGENSAMNVVTAASMAGGRVFTATSSYGSCSCTTRCSRRPATAPRSS